MADELADPGNDENHETGEPQRPGERVQQAHDVREDH
jgi:hypothetical protein